MFSCFTFKVKQEQKIYPAPGIDYETFSNIYRIVLINYEFKIFTEGCNRILLGVSVNER